jgi:hypothetical protein
VGFFVLDKKELVDTERVQSRAKRTVQMPKLGSEVILD